MPTQIEMPKLSDTMTDGTLVEWKVAVGDEIEIGQVIAEIQTDKATMEMEAFDEGTLVEINANAGDKVPVGAILAVLLLHKTHLLQQPLLPLLLQSFKLTDVESRHPHSLKKSQHPKASISAQSQVLALAEESQQQM